MSKKQEVQSAMTAAMKAKNPPRLQAIRAAWNAIRKKEIDTRVDVTDADVEKTLLTLLKQSQESLDQAKAAGRGETVAEIETEMAVWKEFLPQALSPDELAATVAKIYESLKGTLPAGGAGMGMLMKAVMAEVGARASGAEVQAQVKKVIAG